MVPPDHFSATLAGGSGYALVAERASSLGALHVESSAVAISRVSIPLHNPARHTDVNLDGVTSPLDALIVINHLNDLASGIPEGKFLDVSGDQLVSPLDALQVINALNSNVVPLIGEGEALPTGQGIVFQIGASNVNFTPPAHAVNDQADSRTAHEVPRKIAIQQPYSVESTSRVHSPLFAKFVLNAEWSDDLETAIELIADELAEFWR
ncbi:MAG: hypothetical protein H6822_13250 [Planctomycetaceae bacterium]|nr:hypothetical protein [Planctomycetales bacterium]MCB9923144.1 hypothetical protein [Planctomycetaceae bacterium]